MIKKCPPACAAALLCLLHCGAVPGFAVAAQSGTLLRPDTYPYHQCRSPLRPLPGDSRSDWIFYRQEMLDYRRCVETYLTRAREDMDAIRSQMDKAVREFNEASGNF